MAKTIFASEYPMTLLRIFIEGKILRYVVPSRRGTPRGETIGFSEVKYLATLFGLMEMKHKDVATALTISHAMLRKWHSEDSFKKMMCRHRCEFAEVFVRNIWNRIKWREKQIDELLSKDLADIASQELPALDYSEISDAKNYSDDVIFCIVAAMLAELANPQSGNEYLLRVETYAMVGALRAFNGGRMGAETKEKEIEWLNQTLSELLKRNIALLQKPILEDGERKEMVVAMGAIVRSLEKE